MAKKTTKFRAVDWFLGDPAPSTQRPVARLSAPLLPSFWKETSSEGNERLWHEIPDLRLSRAGLARYALTLDRKMAVRRSSLRGEILFWELTSSSRPIASCSGFPKDLLLKLGLAGYFVSQARIMTLGPGAEMEFHREEFDPFQPQAYRLYIPIVTPSESKIEWSIGGRIKAAHLPSKGNAYLINVSELYRAVNRSRSSVCYFVCSLNL